MNHKLILSIFVVLLLLAIIPFSFTASPEPYIFGWLPLPLLYWWSLMVINLIFVLWVAKKFTESAKEEKK
ncbi:hypothetical protein [Paratissierella segnis]|jgi:uncharacterized membrane protein|uniref:DUF3311 domain-containing protein n=1 Tax=Paratissierella segnis TaxID=2763679 RepID=A0A926EPA7_9FIRM|nr:hypothetical protein [Paratissierella segnis]MBC8587208.1 hypothetical protein [Paratissierella segnis]